MIIKISTVASLAALFWTLGAAHAAARETPIPRSMAGDKGQYYLLELKRKGDIVEALHKRVGIESIGYTRTETNCKTMQMRELGYTEESVATMKIKPTDWFDLVQGSSKSDVAEFVCGSR